MSWENHDRLLLLIQNLSLRYSFRVPAFSYVHIRVNLIEIHFHFVKFEVLMVTSSARNGHVYAGILYRYIFLFLNFISALVNMCYPCIFFSFFWRYILVSL
jgi:hypothetical protein